MFRNEMFKSGSAITRKLGSMVAVLAILGSATLQCQAQTEVKGVEATYNVTRSDGTQTVREGTYTFLEGDAGLLISKPVSGSPTNTYLEYIYFDGEDYFSNVSDSPTGGKTATLTSGRGFAKNQELLRAALLNELEDQYESGAELSHRHGVTKIVSDTTRNDDGAFVREIVAEFSFNEYSDRAFPVRIEIRWSREDKSDRVISNLTEDRNQSVLFTYSDIRPPSEWMLAIYGTGGIPIGMKVTDLRDSERPHSYAWAGGPQPSTGLTDGMKVGLTLTALGGFVVIGSAWLVRNFFVRLDGASEA